VIAVPMFVFVVLDFARAPSFENFMPVGFLSIFVTIGTAFLLGSVQVAFRKAVLLATRESLVFTQSGPLRKSERQWGAGELAAICCGNSNTAVNGKKLQQLTVTTKGEGARVDGMFVGREEGELQWLASMLHDFYALPRARSDVAAEQSIM